MHRSLLPPPAAMREGCQCAKVMALQAALSEKVCFCLPGKMVRKSFCSVGAVFVESSVGSTAGEPVGERGV